ncbi:MAG: short chain dehydrogenase family protein [Candidatus Xenolissoclinum pacificiensis L6]|uniref:Short chain dehydrogenase family protein n=1 Tax=Candidatus Xenolissoclinum pacificiensis L6 TaxID=1401685 RepID=W2V2J0_9RICK|nr:MAG: short chain dehydrogenase family protein [Candidatus Xenolissoclinum pacificiensis L6]
MNGTAIITGASQRVGACIADIIAGYDFNILVHYNTSEHYACDIQRKIQDKYSVKCDIVKGDFTRISDIENLMIYAKDHCPGARVLVNNAAVFLNSSFEDLSISNIELLYSVNLQAPLILSSLFTKFFSRGSIINMCDEMVFALNSDRYFYYVLFKKMLKELTTMLAYKLKPVINVNAICPGRDFFPIDGSMKGEYLSKLKLHLKRFLFGNITNNFVII